MADAAGWAASVDNMLLNNAAGDTHAAAAQLFRRIRVVIAAGMDHQRVVFTSDSDFSRGASTS